LVNAQAVSAQRITELSASQRSLRGLFQKNFV